MDFIHTALRERSWDNCLCWSGRRIITWSWSGSQAKSNSWAALMSLPQTRIVSPQRYSHYWRDNDENGP